MREKLFAVNADLSTTNIFKAAEELKLDLAAFRACTEGKTTEPRVKADEKDAAAAGITGTPSFVVGKPSGTNLDGLVIVGAQSLATFEAEIEKLLTAQK